MHLVDPSIETRALPALGALRVTHVSVLPEKVNLTVSPFVLLMR